MGAMPHLLFRLASTSMCATDASAPQAHTFQFFRMIGKARLFKTLRPAMLRFGIVLFTGFFLFSFDGSSQVISGKAPGFEGRMLSLVVYDDLISEKETRLATCKVDGVGNFSLKVEVKETQYAFLRCGRECADLVIEPGKEYTVRFARPQRAAAEETFAARFVQKLEILGGNGKPLNDDLRRFNAAYDAFLEEQYKLLVMRKGAKAVGEATKAFKARMATDVSSASPYLGAHISYSIAQAEAVAQLRRDSLHQRYLTGKWFPSSLEFVRFLSDFHSGVLRQRAKADPKAMQRMVSAPDALSQLETLLSADALLKDPRIRGFVLVSGLRDLFGFKDIDPRRIAAVLNQYADRAPDHYLARAARNVADINTRLLPGEPAPNFVLNHLKGGVFDLRDLNGRTVVIEFTDPKNPLCLEESIAFANLYKTYGNKMEFVTVCIAPTEAGAMEYVGRIDPKWTLCRITLDSDMVTDFALAGVPTYFIIGPTGKFISSPALTPSRGLEGDLIKAIRK
jgi:hypothetical protein